MNEFYSEDDLTHKDLSNLKIGWFYNKDMENATKGFLIHETKTGFMALIKSGETGFHVATFSYFINENPNTWVRITSKAAIRLLLAEDFKPIKVHFTDEVDEEGMATDCDGNSVYLVGADVGNHSNYPFHVLTCTGVADYSYCEVPRFLLTKHNIDPKEP